MDGIDLTGLRKYDVDGYIFTGIKAEDNEHNEQIHVAFRKLATVECKGDRTIALHMLLRNYEDRGMFEAMWENQSMLESRIQDLEKELETLKAPKKTEEDEDTF